ncbi:hypothetical protein DFP72DRAFT_902314 [Ephemerocybe angulata]|uniref:Secreted protein n=1 Tax=Ephemerocybe angulata TaxID=980116 RepID=A0A8H6M2K8_9AGAR|nr:hypothetical protein DFP72DRAFT_902314 [Tulosesus angulatus]
MTLHPAILAARILARLPLCTSVMLAVMSASIPLPCCFPLHPLRHTLSLQYLRADSFYDETGCGQMDPGEFCCLLSGSSFDFRLGVRHVDSPVVT